MGIGVSVFLLAAGAILAFAVHDGISGIDLTTVGYILMAAGAIGIGMFLLVYGPRSRRTGVTTEETVVRDRNVY